MSRIIIFTGSTGGGHNQVANTLRNELEGRGHEVIITDLLKDYSKIAKISFVDTYNFLYKHVSFLYGLIYKSTNYRYISKFSAFVFSRLIKDKLINFISENQPDLIISVHPFGSGILGRFRDKKLISCLTLVLVTDFQAHCTHISSGIDYYIVSNRYTEYDLVKRGVNPKIIRSIGIPISSDFVEKNTKERDDGIFTVLIMGGSEGEKFIKNSLFYIARNKNMNIIVICGKNEKLRRKLNRRYYKKKNVDIRGYEKNIKSLMSKADVIITKPGAITVTEAISQELPIVIPYAIPGHESANAKFLVKSGMARRTRSYLQLAYIIEKMMRNPEILESIRDNIKDNGMGYSTLEFVDTIDAFVTESGGN